MFNQISYNVIIERFKIFAEGHYLIRRFSHGQIDVTDLEKEQEFPWMHVVPVSLQADPGARVFSFDVIFADIPRDKETNTDYQKENISDCIRLAEDLLAEIANGLVVFGPDVELEQGSTITPFIQEYTHTLSGATLALTISVPNNYDACAIPADWSIGGSGSGQPPSPAVSLVLRVNNVNNVNQNVLDLVQGANMTITDLGDGRVKFDASGDLGTNWGTIGGLLSSQLDLQAALDLKADISSLGAVAFSNDYNDLDNLPTIPDVTGLVPYTGATSDVVLGNHNITASNGSLDSIMRPDLFGVENAAGNQYGTLEYNALSVVNSITGQSTQVTASGITFPDATTQTTAAVPQVNSDWNAVGGLAEILNKPTIPSAQGLQDVITTDPQLTNDNTIDGSNQEIEFSNFGKIGLLSNNKLDIYSGNTGLTATTTSISVGSEDGTVQSNISFDVNGSIMQSIDGADFTAVTTEPNALKIATPNIAGGRATVGQVLTLSNPATGEVEFTTVTAGDGTVTSVGLTMPSAFSVAGSPVTTAGTLAVTGAGLSTQYIRGDGQLANFPTTSGGGSSVSYYLNGSISQGVIGGSTYYQMSKTAVFGAGTDFARTNAQGNGLIAQFITDANDPNVLLIPGGNFNIELFFNASSNGGSPSFYVELYKYDGATFTLLATDVATPEGITQGTVIDAYFTALAVPATVMTLTDRLALRVFVTTSGRTIRLHTENGHLCQVITTLSTGVNAINGITSQVQNLASGTSGTDFAISSAGSTHTFNLPTASASARGALSSANWSTFNSKQDALVSGTSIKTINSTSLLGSGNVAVGTVTSVGGTGTTAGLTLSGSVTGSGNLTLGGTLSTPVNTINDSTTVGQNLVKLVNPSDVRYLRINADNTVSALTLAQLKTDLSVGTDISVVLGSNVTNVGTNFEDVTGLSFAVSANKTYKWRATISYAATAAITISSNGPTASLNNARFTTALSATTNVISNQTSYDAGANTAASGNGLSTADGIFRVTASGTFVIRFRCATAGLFTIRAGSVLEYSEVL